MPYSQNGFCIFRDVPASDFGMSRPPIFISSRIHIGQECVS